MSLPGVPGRVTSLSLRVVGCERRQLRPCLQPSGAGATDEVKEVTEEVPEVRVPPSCVWVWSGDMSVEVEDGEDQSRTQLGEGEREGGGNEKGGKGTEWKRGRKCVWVYGRRRKT